VVALISTRSGHAAHPARPVRSRENRMRMGLVSCDKFVNPVVQ
jgi:hypothetical protein